MIYSLILIFFLSQNSWGIELITTAELAKTYVAKQEHSRISEIREFSIESADKKKKIIVFYSDPNCGVGTCQSYVFYPYSKMLRFCGSLEGRIVSANFSVIGLPDLKTTFYIDREHPETVKWVWNSNLKIYEDKR